MCRSDGLRAAAQYSLPEVPLNGSVSLIFVSTADANDVFMTLAMLDAQSQSFNIDFSQTEFNLTGFSTNASIPRPNRTFTTCCSVTVSYRVRPSDSYIGCLKDLFAQDKYGNNASTSAATAFNVNLVTTIPSVTSPVTGRRYNVVTFTYALPVPPKPDTVIVRVMDTANTVLRCALRRARGDARRRPWSSSLLLATPRPTPSRGTPRMAPSRCVWPRIHRRLTWRAQAGAPTPSTPTLAEGSYVVRVEYIVRAAARAVR